MSPFFDSWTWIMAWRDSRTHRRKLVLFMLAIVMGIAALTAINSFGVNLQRAVDDQAKSLLGADLVIRSRQPFTPDQRARLDSLGGERSREVDFASMAYFTASGGTRLVRVKTIEGGYPFYGALDTDPPSAAGAIKERSGALVDQGLMLQFDAQVGDTIRIGERAFSILGILNKAPGQSIASSGIAPTVFIPHADLESTNLIRFGSRAFHRIYFRFDGETDPDALVEAMDEFLTENRLRAETVEGRKEALGRAMDNLYAFLNLVAYIAVLLGSIGVASAIHVYIRQKLEIVAVLRCVGARIRQTFAIYLIQAGVMGFVGSLIGVALGVGIQLALPGVFRNLLVVELDVRPALWPMAEGLLVGVTMTLLFALLPLLALRRVSPLLAIRAAADSEGKSRDPLRYAVMAAIAVVVTGFAVLQTGKVLIALWFTVGLGVAFGLLSGSARLAMALVRRFFPSGLPYVGRQSLANLYRPNNQTVVLVLALGLGVFLITLLYTVQSSLLQQVTLTGSGNQPNLILFDIQVDQREAVDDLVRGYDLPVLQSVPIVTMRLQSVRGEPVADIDADTTRDVPGWVLNREYRSTYRDTLNSTETVLAGQWIGRADPAETAVPISVEQDMAEHLSLAIGDSLVMDVQGVPIAARVGSIREVDWQRVQPNFMVVFPAGVLEEAPQFWVTVTRAPSREVSAAVQRAVVQQFPNVAAVDLALILRTVEGILDQISFVIRFMALFSILTGLIVLAAAVITSRFQRVRESVLLRTLGAVQKQVQRIMLLEYLYLGSLASLAGIGLALGAGWLLTFFLFDTAYLPTGWPLLGIFLGVVGLTVSLGLFNSRGIAGRPPLEVLRAET